MTSSRGDADRLGVVTNPKLYNYAHQQRRARLKEALAQAGSLPCARCGAPVFAELWLVPEGSGHVRACGRRSCEETCWTTWDLGHADSGSVGGVEHLACNRSAGGRNGALKTLAKRKPDRMIKREW